MDFVLKNEYDATNIKLFRHPKTTHTRSENMETITLKYDASNNTVRQLLEGLVFSGLFQIQSEEEKEREEIHENMRVVSKMIADIRTEGSAKYQNMDTFLHSLK